MSKYTKLALSGALALSTLFATAGSSLAQEVVIVDGQGHVCMVCTKFVSSNEMWCYFEPC